MTASLRARIPTLLRQTSTALLGVAIALWALLALRSAWHRVEPLRQLHTPDPALDYAAPIARSFQPLRPHVQHLPEVGFVTQSPDPNQAMLRYYMAQSVLVPTLVVQSPDRPVVIASFEDDTQLDRFLQSHPFTVRHRFGNGLALLDRNEP